MSNPARLLADLFASWTVPSGQSVWSVRGAPSDPSVWKLHRLAATHLIDIEKALDGLEAQGDDVEDYRDVLVPWWMALFLPDVQWGQGQNNAYDIISREDLRTLRLLARYLDAVRATPRIAESQLGDLKAALAEVRELLHDARFLDEEVRRYLWRLVAHAEKVLAEWQMFGDVSIQSAAIELAGAINVVAEKAVPEDKRPRWKKVSENVITSAASSTITQLVLNAGSAAL